MVHTVQTDKFTQFLQATSLSQQGNPYDLDLEATGVGTPNANEFFFSILGCEEDTVNSACGCISTVLTTCGNC